MDLRDEALVPQALNNP